MKHRFLIVLALLTGCQSSEALTQSATSTATATATTAARATSASGALASGPLAPFKDNLFAYRKPLDVRDGGNYLVVPYDEKRDIDKRDEIAVRKVKSQYIRRLPKSQTRDFTYMSGARQLAVYGAGKTEGGARFSVIYLHGKDGTREWGFSDEQFGGNYNRLKNLAAANGGAYYSPDFTDFEAAGVEDIAALISEVSAGGGGRIILACGSMGTQICWRLAARSDTRSRISGLVALSGFPDNDFLRAAYSGSSRQVPLYIAHGSRDPVYDLAQMDDFYNALAAANQPVRMAVFESGNHGTPIRMIDWRAALNWILTQ